MLLERFPTPGLAQVGYVVGDAGQQVAAVIDPRRDVGDYLAWATEHEFTIIAILETHVHADFVSGARELAAATGAPIYADRLGASKFPHQPLEDGDIIPVGNLKLEAFWTPGHTPEHVSYLLFDPARGAEPVALFSGDTLFAAEIGRPDLLGADRPEELVGQLYDTVYTRLAALPDDLVVYPGHGAGSPCGKKIGDAARTSIGQEKRFNYAFQADSREDFLRSVMEGMPQPPAYYPILKRVNKDGPALLRDLPAGEPRSPADVEMRQHAGALLIDTRSSGAFAAGHIPGSINVGLGDSFAIWSGWLTPYDRPLVLILPRDDRYEEARTDLWRVGIDDVAGYLRGGIEAWIQSGRQVETLGELTIDELAGRLDDPENRLVVLDVRDPSEWGAGHVPGSRNIAAGDIARGERLDIARDVPIAVVCGSGYRSSVAASILHGSGKRGVFAVPGGMEAWTASGFPITLSP